MEYRVKEGITGEKIPIEYRCCFSFNLRSGVSG